MKYLSLLFLFLPLTVRCQDIPKKPVNSGIEIGLNLGHALDNAQSLLGGQKIIQHGGALRSSIDVLKNKRNIQWGLTIEGGTDSRAIWYVTPAALVNRKFPLGKSYFYVGGMAGFACSFGLIQPSSWPDMTKGYILGAQTGFTTPTGKRVSFNAECGVRRTQEWQRYGYEHRETYSDIVLYFPLTLGIRYRL